MSGRLTTILVCLAVLVCAERALAQDAGTNAEAEADAPAVETEAPVAERSLGLETGTDISPAETGTAPESESDNATPTPPPRSFAAELADALDVQIHGFVSQGFMLTVAYDTSCSPGVACSTATPNYLTDSSRGSFELTEVGLNFTVTPVDNLRIGAQLFSRDLGPIGNYAIRADWFYVDYRFADWFGIRVGRTKLPFGLYNEFNDVDMARVPILLPQAMYPITSRDLLLAQTGVELYGRVPLDQAGTLEYRAHAGTIFFEAPTNNPTSPFQLTKVEVPYLFGGRVLWETPIEGFRFGGSVQVLRLATEFVQVPVPMPPPATPLRLEVPAVLWAASAEYTDGTILLAIEYGRWHVASESNTPLVPSTAWSDSERAHIIGSYRVNSWFTPGLYYSLLLPQTSRIYSPTDRSHDARDAHLHDVALTLRFDINEHWLVKFETHLMYGTAGLSASQNSGVSPGVMPGIWGAFLLKTTGYF